MQNFLGSTPEANGSGFSSRISLAQPARFFRCDFICLRHGECSRSNGFGFCCIGSGCEPGAQTWSYILRPCAEMWLNQAAKWSSMIFNQMLKRALWSRQGLDLQFRNQIKRDLMFLAPRWGTSSTTSSVNVVVSQKNWSWDWRRKSWKARKSINLPIPCRTCKRLWLCSLRSLPQTPSRAPSVGCGCG